MNNFDKLLKDKLSGHGSPYSEKVWRGIEHTIHPNKDNKKWGLLFIASFLILVTVSLLYFLSIENASSADSNTSSSLISVPESSITESQKSKGILSDLSEPSPPNTDYINSTEESQRYNEKRETSPSKVTSQTTNPSNDNIRLILLERSHPSASTAVAQSKNDKLEDHKIQPKNQQLNQPKFTGIQEKNVPNGILKDFNINQENESYLVKTNRQSKSMPMIDQLSPLNFQEAISLASLEHKIKQADLSMRITEHDVKSCPRFTVFRPGFYFDINYSVDYAIKTLSAKDISYANYAFQRKETENYNYSYSFSARVAYLDPSGFTAKAGFTYSEINEELNYIDPELQNFQTIITIDSIFVNGEWEETRDTSSTPVPGTGLVNKINRYKTISVPLTIAYEWRYNRRFSFFVEGGIQLNLLFNKRGEILSPLEANTLVNFSQDSDQEIEVFNTRFSTGLIFNTGAIYHLNNTIDLYLSSGIRHHPGSLTVANYPVYQRYSVFSIATGVRYKF